MSEHLENLILLAGLCWLILTSLGAFVYCEVFRRRGITRKRSTTGATMHVPRWLTPRRFRVKGR